MGTTLAIGVKFESIRGNWLPPARGNGRQASHAFISFPQGKCAELMSAPGMNHSHFKALKRLALAQHTAEVVFKVARNPLKSSSDRRAKCKLSVSNISAILCCNDFPTVAAEGTAAKKKILFA